jgi:hypothetical protein
MRLYMVTHLSHKSALLPMLHPLDDQLLIKRPTPLDRLRRLRRPLRSKVDRLPWCLPAVPPAVERQQLHRRVRLRVLLARGEAVQPLAPVDGVERQAAGTQAGEDGGPGGADVWVHDVVDLCLGLRGAQDDLGDGGAGGVDGEPGRALRRRQGRGCE